MGLASEFEQVPGKTCTPRLQPMLTLSNPQGSGVNTFISATDPPLFLGVDACRDPGEDQF